MQRKQQPGGDGPPSAASSAQHHDEHLPSPDALILLCSTPSICQEKWRQMHLDLTGRLDTLTNVVLSPEEFEE
jgi:hypothetical protein